MPAVLSGIGSVYNYNSTQDRRRQLFNMFPRSLLHSTALITLLLLTKALAGVYITSPVNATSLKSGDSGKIEWVDDGVHPLLNAIGPSSVTLYTGSDYQQTWLATIAENIDVSKQSSASYTVDPSWGPSGQYYFIRVTSNSLKDPNDSANKYTSYSAKFTLENMSGTFDSTILSQLSATSTPAGVSATQSKSSTSAASATGVVGSSSIATGSILSSSGSSSLATKNSITSSGSAVASTGTSSRMSSVSGIITAATTSAATATTSTGAGVALGRELSHAGIGAILVGCMGLGLAICL